MVHDKPKNGGGIRRLVDDSAMVLSAAGHRVSLLHLADQAVNTTATHEPVHDGLVGEELVFPRTFDPLSGHLHRTRLRRTVAALAPDLIHLHAGFTALGAVLLHDLAICYPTVGQFHDVGSFCYHGSRRFMSRDELCGRRVGRACWRTGCYRPAGIIPKLRGATLSLIKAGLLQEWQRLSRIVVPSAYLRDVAMLHGFPAERLRVVPNFCLPVNADSRASPGPPIILFVGSLLHTKGVHLLLDALAGLAGHSWRAIVVGDGPERANLQAQAQQCGLSERVTFTGALDRAGLDQLYDQCRMFVHTSTIPESFGLVGIEVMTHGKPVVGFRLGGVGEWLLDRETGLAVEPWSVAGLTGGILELLRDPELAATLGAAAQVRTQALFTPERFLDKCLAVYAEAIAHWRRNR